jgi:chromosome segregation protein
MYLKRLELSGFKSFGKKTVLDFTSPVTAIVGPNGSGKSNVVEAIRFVLGEQSIKSMRGKSGTDLIFKGSKGLSAPSRASVGIVFDNRKKIFSFANNSSGLPNIAFDEITLSREVYSDGVNRYSINGSEVRLKDILELLASVHIGSSGHHMISQGEADRVLNASSKDRRSMIEDALGLRVYQYKLRESERKLERTLANMKEVGSLRRELSPHITFLSKQVEKIEKAKELRTELQGLYTTYFANEEYYITSEKAAIEKERLEHEIEAKKITEAKAAVEAPKVEGTSVGLDLTKSTVKWIGTKLKGKHNGTVKIADGNILVKDNKVVGGKFSLDMTSIDDVDMKDDAKMKAKLEGHLKSEDFFNVEKFPKATFEITTISEEGASVNVTGNLTIKDVTKSVTFPAKITYGAI